MRRTSNAAPRAATRAAAVAVLAAAATLLPARPAAPAPAPVEAGAGLGSATVAAATIIYGGYHLTLALGDSDASYQASAAQATSQGVSLPALAAGATGGAAGSCPGAGGGGVPAPTDGPPFAPLTLDSGGGAQHKTSGNLPFGTEEASVGVDPLSASATTSAVSLSLPGGLIAFSGQSTATSTYETGTQRSASARSATDVSLLGGLVKLSGLEWNASHKSGGAGESKATFDIAAARVGLSKLPLNSPADVASALTAVNKTLAPTGLEIAWPKISETPQTASVDGLTLRIKGSQLLNTLLQPVMQLMRALGQLLAPIFNSATGCGFDQLASAVGAGQLVADVLVGVLAGGGEIDLSIGGASAGTEPPPAYGNPFGSGGTQPHPPAPVRGTNAAAPPQGNSLPAPAPAVLPNPGTLPKPQPSAAPVAAPDGPASVAYRLACISTNTAGPQHCSPGARALGLSSLVILALAVFAADLYQGRRRRPLPHRRVL